MVRRDPGVVIVARLRLLALCACFLGIGGSCGTEVAEQDAIAPATGGASAETAEGGTGAGTDGPRCSVVEPWDIDNDVLGSTWCAAEYRAYWDCTQGDGRADPGVCDELQRAAEECLLGSGVPTLDGGRALRTCVDYCIAEDPCVSSSDLLTCVGYLCTDRAAVAPFGGVYLASSECAAAWTSFWECSVSSGDVCNLPGPCEAPAAAIMPACEQEQRQEKSPLPEACTVYCVTRYPGDRAAVGECIDSFCLNRAEGQRLEEHPLCCQAALLQHVDCLGHSNTCDATSSRVAAFCEQAGSGWPRGAGPDAP